MRDTLQQGFLLPDGVHPWGTRLDVLGVPRSNQVAVAGVVELSGLTLHAPVVVSGGRGIVRVATYQLHEDVECPRLEALLGEARVQAVPNQGSPHQVAATWSWDVGQGVDVALSWYAAKRGLALGGLYLGCSEERLAVPFLAAVTADAPWRSPGRVEALGVPIEPCELTVAQVALRRPGLCTAPAWAGEGIWDSAGFWGVSDGGYTSVHTEEPTAWVHERLLPARGAGGSSLAVDGVVVLVCVDPRGLDAVAERLRARPGVTLVLEEHHDC